MGDDYYRSSRSNNPMPVFCGNFEYDAQARDIEKLFDKYGPIERIDMKTGELLHAAPGPTPPRRPSTGPPVGGDLGYPRRTADNKLHELRPCRRGETAGGAALCIARHAESLGS
eukprot:evm.model.scf_732EXC.5 EVM.evm.TU.scf_732EXC.5   scf_732EXC:25373-26168(-)